MIPRLWYRWLIPGSMLGSILAMALSEPLGAQRTSEASTAQERMHQSDQWLAIEAHLPNPATASAKQLELQADILRARRFPVDAMDYYRYAIDRGGNVPAMLNKMGLTELEMHNVQLSRAYFLRAVKLNRKDAEAWNNLGAADFLSGQTIDAVSDYKRALKLKKHEAVFHSNLGSAYFERKDYPSARREIAEALKLDPEIYERDNNSGGIAAHVLSSEDRARFDYEMARLYAHNGQEEAMLHSLAKASEAGMEVQREMHRDAVLAKYELDPRVVLLVHNAQALRTTRSTTANATGTAVPSLTAAKPLAE